MGTNYYTKIKVCEHCKRYERIHLGKSSSGWRFTFQYNGGLYYKNATEMKAWLADKVIINEDRVLVAHSEFWGMVEEKQKEKLNMADYMTNKYPTNITDFLIEGYSFSNVEFC